MDTIKKVQLELSALCNIGKIKYIFDDEQDDAVLDSPDLFEILYFHNEFSKLFSFVYLNRFYHFLIHFAPDSGIQDKVQFFWDTSKSLQENDLELILKE